MYNKVKSEAFLALLAKGKNNPIFGKAISQEELAKRMIKVYVYDSSKQFIKCYASVGLA